MTLIEKIITLISFYSKKEKRALIKKSAAFNTLKGIEIGGPSEIFKLKGIFPIYLFANKIDGVNFSNNTLWEGNLAQGNSYQYYSDKMGYQYIGEASDLSFIENYKYDFVLSCHSLEHLANPIKALNEWSRILKDKGTFVLILPNPKNTFDCNRPITKLAHLIDDFNNNTLESDTTHFEEVIALHDLQRDNFIEDKNKLEERTKNNLSNRAIHHHVFTLELIRALLNHVGFKIDYQQSVNPFHLVTIPHKLK